MPPMNQPVKGLPRPIYADFKEGDQKTEVTVLPNGLRIASENRFGEFCTVGGINVFMFLYIFFIKLSFSHNRFWIKI